MRVGIYSRDFVEWAGGLDILRLLVTVTLAHRKDCGFDPVLLVPWGQCRSSDHPDFAFSKKNIIDFFQGQLHDLPIVFYKEENLQSVIKKNRLEVLLPVHTTPKQDFGLPWVGYIYDFQHRYIAEHYTPEECKRRDRLFADILFSTRSVIVNSLAVKRDVERFFPDATAEIYALPFCPIAHNEWFSPNSRALSKYSLPEKYFCICNQFWIHKEHRTAFRAFAKFIRECGSRNVGLVCTGRTKDRRFIPKGYVESLLAEVHKNDGCEQIHILGHIPKRDQIEILKCAEALIQPTLFEGGPGGGSVYDAVALGVPCILSDIPVNREVHACNIKYFSSRSPDHLAQRMREIMVLPPPRPTTDQLRKQQAARMAVFARCIAAAVKRVIE